MFIHKTISHVIGLIYKLQYILPQKILLSLYNTLFLQQINYCILLWGKIVNSKSILLLRKRASRAVSSAHSEPLFKIHNVLKVDDIYQQRLLVFYMYYNVVNNIISANFNDFLPVLSVGSHTYPIRNLQRQLPKHSHEFRGMLTFWHMSNEIFSITGKYYNTIIAEIFGNERLAMNVCLILFMNIIHSFIHKTHTHNI